MLQLLIDGKRVNLSSDTSFEFYDRNPLFSKEGQHTLDIDIDLGDPVNANIYKNMYRIDVLRRPSGRSAVLFSERGVIIRGTEVVLQVDERVAKIQLVAGNSELNYLSGGDSYIKDLDLGEITNLDITTAAQSLQGTYPTWDYVCAPICTQATFFHNIMPVLYEGDYITMNTLRRTATSHEEQRIQYAEMSKRVKGVTVNTTEEGFFTLSGTASSGGGNTIALSEPFTLEAGTHTIQTSLSTTVKIYFKNNTAAVTKGPYKDGDVMTLDSSEEGQFVVGFNLTGGTAYDETGFLRLITTVLWGNVIELKNGTTLCPQPYLAAMVRKVITALGYNITTNFIETDQNLKRIILVNGYHATKFSEMVPNWKVDEFLSEVEKFTGCIIIVNQFEKTVQIIQRNRFYQNAPLEIIEHDQVIGEIEKKYDEEAPQDMFYHNVKYVFPDSEIYRYWAVSEEFLNSLVIQQCPGILAPESRQYSFLIDIWTALNGGNLPSVNDNMDPPQSVVDQYNKMIAYEDLGMPALGTYFVLRNAENRTSSLRRLNYYGPRYDKRTEDTLEIKIVPAEVVWKNNYAFNQMWCQPYLLARNADTATTVTSEEQEKGLNELIAEETQGDNQANVLYAAFYLGLKDNNFSGNKRYPIMAPTAVPSNEVERFYTSEWTVALFASWWTLQEIISYGEPQCCMSINALHGMYNTFWKNNLNVNFTQPCTIRFRDIRNRDARSIFVIGNKKFYCQQLKYRCNAEKVSEIVEGTFFPLKGNNDEPYVAETVNIQVLIKTDDGKVRLYADKTLNFPITIQLAGSDGNDTYSSLVIMEQDTNQKFLTLEWITQCANYTATIYQHEQEDENTYNFTITTSTS